ncbi:unnamed protein product [Miscanthus lutarioriparius]|uniref:Uncharacterized protein n=1 Tax=Miscanthus lutarioriparius TaxID=422564 RepID=A0A811SRT5_9POAL|nr:unnamed protein product [Miscanthus lutarioriparius]
MALPSAVVEEGVSTVFSYISTKVEDKASRADTIARLEIALARLDIALEKTGRIPITYVSLLRSRKDIKGVYMEGTELLNKHKKPQNENDGHVVVRSSSYLQWIADRAANFSISSLVGLGKEKLSSSVAQKFERYADWAEKFVAEVESGCPLRLDTFRYPFLKHLLEGKSLRCEIVKNPSHSLSLDLHPVIVEGRGVEVILLYQYNDLRKLGEHFSVVMNLRISEDTDIIGTSIKCIQRLTSQFKLVAESAIGELTLLPNLQDTFHSYVLPPSYIKEKYGHLTDLIRPDPICCNGNSCGTLAKNSSIEIPEPVILVYFSCCISAPKNSLRNAPLVLDGIFVPHVSLYSNDEMIRIQYGGKQEKRSGGSVQQLEEIARSDALDYLVHEPEPTDYALCWLSTHGVAFVTLKAMPRPSRRVSKRKR